MTKLHAYYTLRNQQAFQRLLDASTKVQSSAPAPLSSSGGRSWTKPSPLSSSASNMHICDINARDWNGRTVLHLAVSALDAASLEYVKLLLGHPKIDVNAVDVESRWSALHRAMYVGNIAASLLLLQRFDVNTSLKDYEGYTAFDLYNSTVEGTKPSSHGGLRLFTWGANRNASLGVGDGNDRAYPDEVMISRHDETVLASKNLTSRFAPVHIKGVEMSRLHTAVITAESSGNIRACGFGNGGRLGPGQHTQYNLITLPQFSYTITSVALGQDHTLALTDYGDVLSWGLNRFAQLGYIVEPALSGLSARAIALAATEEPIQAIARKIIGPLKKEFAVGVAACKTASACWTQKEVFTWGTNAGQLGYDKLAQPVQVLPRKVSQITHPVIGIALTDSAMACLLNTHDVVCFSYDRYFRISFPTQSFPPTIQPTYRPPTSANNAHIAKIVSCDGNFAALTANGEIFTFSMPSSTTSGSAADGKDKLIVKPQRVWALRNQYSAVKDVALGADGTIILCTDSGHVYVRSRNVKGSQSGGGVKAFNFQCVPYMQRVVRVGANNTGAFAALREDVRLTPINIQGNSMEQDLWTVQPYMEHRSLVSAEPKLSLSDKEKQSTAEKPDVTDVAQEDEEDIGLERDIMSVRKLCRLLILDRDSRRKEDAGLFDIVDGDSLTHGADLLIRVGGAIELPAHRVILASRCPALAKVFVGQAIKESNVVIKLQGRHTQVLSASSSSTWKSRLSITGCHPLSILILLVYFYSDELLAIWDRRIGLAVEQSLTTLKINTTQIRLELQILSRVLSLAHLSEALVSYGRRSPKPSMTNDMRVLLDTAQGDRSPDGVSLPIHLPISSPLAADTTLELVDKHAYCHSVVLRARSPFFANFFDDRDWTVKRRRADLTVSVNLNHLSSRVMSFVLRYIYCGEEERMFDALDFVHSTDDALEFLFEIMAAASELLLDRLSLICSSAILKHVNIYNVCAVLTEAMHFHANQLVASLQEYMACNMETLLESRMLDDLSTDPLRQLTEFVRTRQADKLPVTRSNKLVNKAMETHADWLALQDIPQPIVRNKAVPLHQSPKLSPVGTGKMKRRQSAGQLMMSPLTSPALELTLPTVRAAAATAADDIFPMDEPDIIPPLELEEAHPASSVYEVPSSATPPASAAPWKGKLSQVSSKVDLKAIMAEAESSKVANSGQRTPVGKTRVVGFDIGDGAGTPKWASAKQSPRNTEISRSGSASPWRISVPLTDVATSSDLTKTAAGPGSQTRTPAPSNEVSGLTRMVKEGIGSAHSMSRSSSGQPTTAQLNKPSLGPIFSPARQAPAARGPSTPRRVSDTGPTAKAWSGPSVQAPPKPVIMSTSVSPPSFLAIQQQQFDQDHTPRKAKQSLREIQEEEQARQAEADFMKWWAEEEERVRIESQLLTGGGMEGEDTKKKERRRPKAPSKATSKLPSQGQGNGSTTTPARRPRPSVNKKESRVSIPQVLL